MAGQAAVAFKFLSFLAHRCQLLNGSIGDVNATNMNPGFLTTTGVTRDVGTGGRKGLQDIVNRRVLEVGKADADADHPEFRKLRFALVDLSGANRTSPKFAGANELTQGGLGSMAKMACMYAAYQLKFDLEDLAKSKGLTTQQSLFTEARKIWGDTQKPDKTKIQALFAGKPKIELSNKLVLIDGKPVPIPRPLSSPDLEKIFVVTPAGGGLDIKFKGSDLILVDDPATPGAPPHTTQTVEDWVHPVSPRPRKVRHDCAKQHHTAHGGVGAIRSMTFAERMFLMIDNSDNAGAHACIENVSFLYIHSLLWQSDLYRPDRGGGLWEASTHDVGGARWIKPPVPRGAKGSDFVSATAASIAALLTLMEQGRLVSPKSSAAMKHLMSKTKTGLTLPDGPDDDSEGCLGPRQSYTRSYFRTGLRDEGIAFDRLHSKLGIGDFQNDGAIIARTPQTGKHITYVAAGFDDNDPAGRNLGKLIVQLDKCIQENNGLISASTP
jgi:hypothetical protein